MTKTNNQVIDVKTFLDHDYRNWCVDNPDTLVTLQISNHKGEPINIQIPGKEMIFNVFFWKPLIRRNLPIVKERHLFHDEDFTSDTIRRINTEILLDVIKHRLDTLQALKVEFIRGIEEINNFINTYLSQYAYMVDIFSIAETLTDEKAKEVVKTDVEHLCDHGVKVVEKECQKIQKRTNDYFSDKSVKPNIFYPAIHLKTLNPTQFAQMIACIGTRTDTDESMIRWPVQHSFMEGLGSIEEYCLESLAAKKSKMYNKKEMADAQYTNRKFQLNGSAIYRIYPGDCGTDVTIPFMISEFNHKQVFGKYFLEDGKKKLFNEENAHHYIGKRINIFSPMTCRHTDGYCHKCGGFLAEYFFPPTLMPGVIAGSEVMSPLVQQILSNKHMATTFATLYTLPAVYKDIFVVKANQLFIKKEFLKTGMRIGIPYACGSKISDLKHTKGPIRDPEYFTVISELCLGDNKGNILEASPMQDENQTVPNLSIECLEYLRKNPEKIEIKDSLIWIDISEFPPSKPLITATIFNYSTKLFVERIQRVFEKDIVSMHSCTYLLEMISDLIWKRSKPNLLHIETICKSFLKEAHSCDIPVVTDPEDVHFSHLDHLIPLRSYGTQVGFEQFLRFISTPSPFMKPRVEGPNDNLIGFLDRPTSV